MSDFSDPDFNDGWRPAGVAGFRSEGGHDIDWPDFDRRVDGLSPERLRQELKIEARLRADGTDRVRGDFEA